MNDFEPRTSTRPRQRRRAPSRGVTLVEVSAVGTLVAVALVGYTLLVAPSGRSAEVAAATRVGEHLGAALAAWRADHGDACPTFSQLVHEGYLDARDRVDDPWGNRFRVKCGGRSLAVVSAGPDGAPNTPDDLAFPVRGD